MKEYIVYIVHCSDNSYYTGITNDIERRILEHNGGINPTCYTYKRRPVKLIFQQSFREVSVAIAMEKQIKGWSRKKKEALLRGEFELLSDLSENERQRRIRWMRQKVCKCVGVMLRPREA